MEDLSVTALALHLQIARGAVETARADAAITGQLESAEQVRSAWDTSGTPAGISAVIVRTRDLGGYAGVRSRAVVQVELRYSVRTHLDEDQDATAHDALVSAVQVAAAAPWAAVTDGWVVRHRTAPEVSDVDADGSGVFRQADVVQTLLCQAIDGSGTPVEPPGPEAPAEEAENPADDSRLTIWIAEGAAWVRQYITLEGLRDSIGGGGGGGDGEVDGGAPDAVYLAEQVLDGGTV